MNQRTVSVNEYKEVIEVATKYVEALRIGNIAMLTDIFHKDCITYGTVDGQLIGGASNPTADFINNYGKSTEMVSHIDVLDITPTTAVVRIVMEKDAVGSDCNDYLSFIKVEQVWKVIAWILSQYKARNNVRRSMLQASIFDPRKDHVRNAQLQFPCMQQVSFMPTSEGLIINAFYATQQIFVKAYGNCLGIAQLGAFIAHEMNMSLFKINITIGVAKLQKITKEEFRSHILYSIIEGKCINSCNEKDEAEKLNEH